VAAATGPQRGSSGGSLRDVRVVEMVGLGPVPQATSVLAQLGADVVRVDRVSQRPPSRADPVNRDRPAVRIDVSDPAGADLVLRLVGSAQVLIDPFRPGVMERLGLGPDVCLDRRPALLYVRVTGWGQEGPLAMRAGHDINYLARAGALYDLRRESQPPSPPLNLLGDYAAGSLYMIVRLLVALRAAQASGRGRVLDVAIVDGLAWLLEPQSAWRAAGAWDERPGANLLQTAAPFYDVYETAEGEYMAVGAIEPKFYDRLLAGLGLDAADLPGQYDRSRWPEIKRRFAEIFRTRTREQWQRVFDDQDACVTPVLSPREAGSDPHMLSRVTATAQSGTASPAAAQPAGDRGYTCQVLRQAGVGEQELLELLDRGVIG
jgi:alpha-methylacyl-CoA racemase